MAISPRKNLLSKGLPVGELQQGFVIGLIVFHAV